MVDDLIYKKSQTLREEPIKVTVQVDKPSSEEIDLKFGQKTEFIPKHSKQTRLFVRMPTIEQVLQYCWSNLDDDECKKILVHTLPITELRLLPDETLQVLGLLEKKQKQIEEKGYFEGRSGGGWKGAFMKLLSVLRKMIE